MARTLRSRAALMAAILLLGALASTVSAQEAKRDPDSKPDRPPVTKPVWQVALPDALRGRLYQTIVLPGERPTVLATSPEAVVELSDEVRVVLPLMRNEGRVGESAILPSADASGEGAQRIGILVHDHHAIARFRLVDRAGKSLVELDDARHFHYRLAPDGSGFVGIDSGGIHAAGSAPVFTYRFFDARGKLRAEVESPQPSGQDSAYTPDAARFLVNSAKDGLTAYRPGSAEPVWNVPSAVKRFAAANGSNGRVLLGREDVRSAAELHAEGKRVWAVDVARMAEGQNVRNVAIAPGGKLAAVSGDHAVWIFEGDAAEPVASHSVGETLVINSLAVSDLGFVALGAQSANAEAAEPADGRVVVLDARGGVRLSQEIRMQRPNAWTPTVQLDAAGHRLLVRNLEQVVLFDLAPREAGP